VPKVLQLLDRLIDDTRRQGKEVPEEWVEDGGEDPWLDTAMEHEEEVEEPKPPKKAKAALPDWQMLDGILTGEEESMDRLHDEANAFLADASKPAPLCLPADADRQDPGVPLDSGSFAPRGQRPARQEEAAATTVDRRLPAQSPYYSGDPALLLKVAKAPLSNLDGLVTSLTPGADITTEGLLKQLGDEELVLFAYAMEQIAEAASKHLVKELETRDELRSTCMHRREYLQLLDGALSRTPAA